LFGRYRDERLVISTKSRLTAAGVKAASAKKQQLLKQLVDAFTKAINTGDPKAIAASTYYLGLAQWEYGDFLKNVQLPSGLTDEEKAAAQKGSAGQAETYYAQARSTWQALVQKADADETLKNDPRAAPWIERARNALNGNVDLNPPTAARNSAAQVVGE
jgi:hypothetical protein